MSDAPNPSAAAPSGRGAAAGGVLDADRPSPASITPSASIAGAGPAPSATDVDQVLVLDYGGQYSQLIARRVRDCGVFSELLPHHVPLEQVAARKPKGIILSGGP